mgnify:CR=1 FL=1
MAEPDPRATNEAADGPVDTTEVEVTPKSKKYSQTPNMMLQRARDAVGRGGSHGWSAAEPEHIVKRRYA